VPEVDAALEQLAHGHDGHVQVPPSTLAQERRLRARVTTAAVAVFVSGRRTGRDPDTHASATPEGDHGARLQLG